MTREETILELTQWAESIFNFVDSTRKQFEELRGVDELDIMRLNQLKLGKSGKEIDDLQPWRNLSIKLENTASNIF